MNDADYTTNQYLAPSKPKNPNKPYLITLGILSFFIIALGIIDIVIYTSRNNDSNINATTSKAFENLTKEEAVAFLRAQTNVTGTLPDNYVREEITNAIITDGNTIISNLLLIYSYDTIEELRELAHDHFNGLSFLSDVEEYDDNNFEITEYDYYAIVTPKRIKGATTCDSGYYNDCDSLLSFKRSYLDYRQEETTPNSFEYNYYFNTRDADIINYLLRVYTVIKPFGHGNIYSYSFEEQNDKYVLTVNNVGIGINSAIIIDPDSYTDNMDKYGINLYSTRYAVDKSDGHVFLVPTKTETTDYVKTFPITEEELVTFRDREF